MGSLSSGAIAGLGWAGRGLAAGSTALLSPGACLALGAAPQPFPCFWSLCRAHRRCARSGCACPPLLQILSNARLFLENLIK